MFLALLWWPTPLTSIHSAGPLFGFTGLAFIEPAQVSREEGYGDVLSAVWAIHVLYYPSLIGICQPPISLFSTVHQTPSKSALKRPVKSVFVFADFVVRQGLPFRTAFCSRPAAVSPLDKGDWD